MHPPSNKRFPKSSCRIGFTCVCYLNSRVLKIIKPAQNLPSINKSFCFVISITPVGIITSENISAEAFVFLTVNNVFGKSFSQ